MGALGASAFKGKYLESGLPKIAAVDEKINLLILNFAIFSNKTKAFAKLFL